MQEQATACSYRYECAPICVVSKGYIFECGIQQCLVYNVGTGRGLFLQIGICAYMRYSEGIYI